MLCKCGNHYANVDVRRLTGCLDWVSTINTRSLYISYLCVTVSIFVKCFLIVWSILMLTFQGMSVHIVPLRIDKCTLFLLVTILIKIDCISVLVLLLYTAVSWMCSWHSSLVVAPGLVLDAINLGKSWYGVRLVYLVRLMIKR